MSLHLIPPLKTTAHRILVCLGLLGGLLSKLVVAAEPSGVDEIGLPSSLPGHISDIRQLPTGDLAAVRTVVRSHYIPGMPRIAYRWESTLLHSGEGDMWTDRHTTSRVRALAQNDSSLIAVGNDGSIHYTEDGLTWTAASFDRTPAGNFTDALFADDTYYALLGAISSSNEAALQTPELYRSSDGKAWTFVSRLPYPAQKLACGNGAFIAISPMTYDYGSRAVLRSVDGVNWQMIDQTRTSLIAYGNGRFLASDGTTTMRWSVDGLTWNTVQSGIASVDRVFILPGRMRFTGSWFQAFIPVRIGGGDVSSQLFTSPDGINWYKRSSVIPSIVDDFAPTRHGTFAIYGGPSYDVVSSSLYRSVQAFSIPEITVQPPAQVLSAPGASRVASMDAMGGFLSFQWYEGQPGDVTKPLANGNDRCVALPSRLDPARFWVRASNSLGHADSGPVELLIKPHQPEGCLFAEGSSGVLARLKDMLPTGTIYQWSKDNQPLPAQTNMQLTAHAVSLSDAGRYSVITRIAGRDFFSSNAVTGVVRVTPGEAATKHSGNSLKLTQVATGPGLSFHWFKNHIPMTEEPGRVTGTQSSSLSFSRLKVEDIGNYECRVSLDGATLTGYRCYLNVIGKPSVIQLHTPVEWQVGLSSTANVQFASEDYVRVEMTGLPPGMSYNRVNGEILGTPRKTGTYRIAVRGVNRFGAGLWRVFTITVAPLPENLAGTYIGLVGRDVGGDPGYGGRLLVTILPSGHLTGNVDIGVTRYPFKGSLQLRENAQPELWLQFAHGWLVAALKFDPANGGVSGLVALKDFSFQLPLEGRKVLPVKPNVVNTNWLGRRSVKLSPDAAVLGNAAYPQEEAIGQITVRHNGSYTWTGRLSDGAAYTMAGQITPQGAFAARTLLYGKRGSIQGWQELLEPEGRVSGFLEWIKYSRPGDASFPDGFPLHSLDVREPVVAP